MSTRERKLRLKDVRVAHHSFVAQHRDLRRAHDNHGIAAAGRAWTVVGPPCSGRTFLADSLLLKNPEGRDEGGMLRPVVVGTTPIKCDEKPVLLAILAGFGVTGGSRLGPERLMRMLEVQVAEQGTKTIVLDRFQRVTTGVREDRARAAVGAVRDMVAEVGCLFIGFGDRRVERLFDEDGVPGSDSAGSLRIEPYAWRGDGQRHFCDAMRELDCRMPTDEPSGFGDDVMALRFHIASAGHFPRAVHLVNLAAVDVLDDGRTRSIGPKDLAAVYRRLYRVPDKDNPFLAADPTAVRPPKGQAGDPARDGAAESGQAGGRTTRVPGASPEIKSAFGL